MSTQELQHGFSVLTFHRIVRTKERDHDVEWRTFCSLLEELSASGSTITTDLAPTDFSAGDVVLTFDDGTQDHLSAGTELAERGMKGVFFVSAGKIGETGYLNEGEVRQLHSLGHVIGSHGMKHVPLDSIPPREMLREVQNSKHILETTLSVPVTYFAPTGGIATPSLPQAVARAGYLASRSTRWGVYTSLSQRWSIPHVPVTQLTAERGWVLSAIQHKQIPVSMSIMRYGRNLVPRSLRAKARSAVHRVLRPSDT